ncbi:DUF3019 domain-containing protein [Colwellia sp. MSW7]|uniref:DUF3019 domain-containing protein n=1 Tax=Colwellia maritima TaxID=2912588 RepID=A0ABS9X0E1_9GAMM|nr:DUF3019 domain-containing protein [Colwellia maritima]MCI2283227.1 DUF3019 domain-containing protein [Colwellia maritima]
MSYIPLSTATKNPVVNDNIELRLQPQQCVTLRQGRDCFATIKVQWQKTMPQSLCLYQVNKKLNDQRRQLKCWENNHQGQINIEFESSETIIYQLRTQQGDRLVAQTKVVVSWLHKNTTRRRHWRLF